VNFGSIKKMENMGLVPKTSIDPNAKCEIRVQAKYARKPFKTLEACNSKLLKLIHSDVSKLLSLLKMTSLDIVIYSYLKSKKKSLLGLRPIRLQ